MNRTTGYQFTNWAKNESCKAKELLQPEIEEEIQAIVKSADKIRVVGSGHSWSGICLTEETLINFDKYNQVLELNKEALQVRIQPGMKLWELNEYLDQHGLALKNLGSISTQSVAGAISSGTHGSGINYQILGSQIEQMSLITANGEKKVLHRQKDKDLFDLAVVNLGALGIISELTLNIIPAFNLHEQVYLLDFEEALSVMEEILHETDHFKMWWFPHTDKIIMYRHQRTQEPANDSRFRQWLMDEFISVYAYRFLLKLGTMFRSWRPAINTLLLQNFNTPIDRIEKSFKVFNVPEPPLHREAEWSIDLKDAKSFLKEYKKMIDSSTHRINFLQEIRFTKADDYALSACQGRDSIWVGCYNADNFGWPELMKDFETLAMKYNGRPHWGKEFTVSSSYLRSVYPKLGEFEGQMKSWDPTGKFMNRFMENIFYR